jgi:ribose/xylose/arabinose/galactoside ABC-type transport system permease subunit
MVKELTTGIIDSAAHGMRVKYLYVLLIRRGRCKTLSTESDSITTRIGEIKTSILVRRESSVLIAFIAILVLGTLVSPEVFLTLNNFVRVLRGVAIITLVGYGMSLLMISGEFDLSVGSLVAVTGGVAAVMISSGVSPTFAIVLTITLAVVYGITQGLLVTKFDLPSLIVTIGTLTLLRGVHFILLGGEAVTISTQDMGPVLKIIGGAYSLPFSVVVPFTDVTLFTIPAITYAIPGIHEQTQTFQYFPTQIVWVFVFLAVFHHILFRTTFGRHVRATGDNIESTRTTGIDPERVKIAGFVIIAVITAFAGLSQVAYIGSVSPSTGSGTALIVIAAVVLGGTKLTGGDGTMTGVLLGALILGFAQNILTLGGFGPRFGRLITGLFIIGAISLDTIFDRFSIRVLREWYSKPLRRISSDPRSFFSQQADKKGSDESLAFIALSTVATGVIISIIIFTVDIISPQFADRFVLYIAEANLSGAVMVFLELYLVVTLLILLALFTVQFVSGRLDGQADSDNTLVAVSYGMAPVILLSVPLLLEGFGFLTLLVFSTLVIVALLVALMLYLAISELHDLSPRDAAITVAATFVVWIVAVLYLVGNLT